MNPQETAAALSERGYIVHALTPLNHESRGKAPIERNWQKRTETHLNTIRNDRGIGVLTGRGLLVVDTDIDEAKNGEAALVALYERHGAGIPPEPVAQTGGGGYHRWYRVESQTPRNTASKLGPGIDTRGDGGQVVVPPSPHSSGQTYAWTHGLPPALDELPTAPAWMLDVLQADRPEPPPEPAAGVYAEGNRNDALTRAIGRWLRLQSTLPTRDQAESWARRWNREHCHPPLPGKEAAATARSIHVRERTRRAAEQEHEFEPPADLSDQALVFNRVFTGTENVEIESWERHNNHPAPTTFRLRTDKGPVYLPTLTRYPTARDAFSTVDLDIRPEYRRQLAWQTAAGWLRDCAVLIDNVEEDDEGVSDWLVSWINNARHFNPPQIELSKPDEIALSVHDLVAFLDRHTRVGQWSAHEVRTRLRDAGFKRARGYWHRRAAYIIRDRVLYDDVEQAVQDFQRRAAKDPTNLDSREQR